MIENMRRFDASDIIDGLELLYFRNFENPKEYQKIAEKVKNQIIQDINELKFLEVLRIIDLYEYDENFHKFLLYNLSNKLDMSSENGLID